MVILHKGTEADTGQSRCWASGRRVFTLRHCCCGFGGYQYNYRVVYM